MQGRKILLQLFPGHMTVAATDGGRIRDAARLPFSAGADPNDWTRALRQAAPLLAEHVTERKCAGASAVVVYSSPTSAVDLHGASVSSPAAAADAALLSCADALPYSALSAVQQAVVIGRDSAGEQRQHHVLVASEREDITAAIVELVEQSGLKFQAAAPVDALVLHRLAAEALKCPDSAQGHLYIGEHSSFFIVGGAGSIDFERRLSFDIEAMVAALRRPILRGGHTGEQASIELAPGDARHIVHQHGVPDRDAIVYDPVKLTGTQVIPLLQPLLQRLIVELRQSIRFGVNDKDRAQIPIVMSGPGVCIPHLAETVSNELGQPVTIDAGWSDFDFDDPACACGELCRAVGCTRLINQLNLQPRELAGRRRISRMKRWLWTGAAAAMVVIGLDFLQYEARLTGARQNADVLSMSASDIDALRETTTRMQTMIGALAELESAIESETGQSVSFRALMNEVSQRTPPSIRLTSFNVQTVDEEMVASLSGYSFNEDGDADRAALQKYVESLRSSPLFDEVTLGNVQLGSISGLDGRRFDARATLVAAPWEIVEQRIASGQPSPGPGQSGGGVQP